MATDEKGGQKICISYERNMYSKGFWFGENPLDTFIPLSMFQMILFFTISRILYFLLRPLKQPKVVCNVLGGLLLGPSVLGRYTTLMDKLFPLKGMLTINTLSSFAMTCFVFLITVKTDKLLILRTAKDVWILGLLCIFVPLGISFTLFNLLKGLLPGIRDGMASFALCSVLSSNFLSDIAYSLEKLKLLTSELGQLAMSSAMINDVVGWTILAMAIISSQLKSSYSLDVLLFFIVTVIFVLYGIRPNILWIIKTTPEGKTVHQKHVVSILIQALVMGAVTDALGMGVLSGVMLIGMIIPHGPPLGSAITEKTELILNELFMPFFYLRLGRIIDINKIKDWKEFNALLLIIISGYLAKFLIAFLYSLFCKMRVRNVVLLGLILNLKGPVKFIYFIRFLTVQHIDEQSFALLVLTNAAITGIATPLVKYFYKPHLRLETSLLTKRSTMSLQSTPMIGELTVLSCIHSEDDVHGTITLLEASNPTPVTTIYAYVIHLIELVGRATPLLAPYGVSKKVGNSSTDRIMRAFTNYSKASDELVSVEGFTSVAPYKTMFESICRLAQLKHVSLIIVPFHKSQIGEINANFRCFNIQMQAYAPCTVGILVQRGLSCVTSFEFSCNIAVIFIGGADDREALALAARMSGHPRVKITVMRIILRENQQENDELEQQFDHQLLEHFKTENETNVCVQCLDVLVNDSLEIFSWIRSLENNYDLVMVGKRQGTLRLQGDMESWAEYPELGVIGDMVASEDFCRGMVSVLVLQHCMLGGTSRNQSTKSERSSSYSCSSLSLL